MTRGRNHSGHGHEEKKAKPPSRFSVFLSRLLVASLALAVALGAALALIDRGELPPQIRNAQTVKAAYQTKDRAVSAGNRLLGRETQPAAAPDAKQQGYPAKDRQRLEEIISKGAQGHD